MTGSRSWGAALAAAVVALLLTGCNGDSRPSKPAVSTSRAAECTSSVSSLLAVTQRYLDAVGGTRVGGSPGGESPRPDASSPPAASPTGTASVDLVSEQEQFTSALKNIRAYASSRGCDPRAFEADLATGLRTLRTGGPVAKAVLLQLRGAPAPRAGAALRPGDDVAAAIAAAPDGGTVLLGAGTFALSDTVALLRGVTLRGAGRDSTTLQATVASGPLLVLSADRVTLQDLTIRRTGSVPGPVVSAGPTATLTVSHARVSGARADRSGLGGVGILMSGGPGGQTAAVRRTTLTVIDSELVDNAVAGVVLAGEHRADIRRTLFARSAQCGICFLATSDGLVRDSRFVDNGAGVVSAGDARPKLTESEVTGGQVGIQVIDRSAPEISNVTVTGPVRAAMIWTATARGRVEGNRCLRVTFGIVVGPHALPYLGANACGVARGRQ